MRKLVLLVALVACALVPGTAGASTAFIGDDEASELNITYRADPGETNHVLITPLPDDRPGVRIYDNTATIVPGLGCVAVDPHTVDCESTPFWHGIFVELLDGSDRLEAVTVKPRQALTSSNVVLDVEGGEGGDVLGGARVVTRLNGGPGDDILQPATLTDRDGKPLPPTSSRFNRVHGGPGNDKVSGTAGEDHTEGGAGDDVIRGEGGNDTLSGDDGNDVLRGGSGEDGLSGDHGNDKVLGGADRDFIRDGRGDDQVFGFGGTDRIFEGPGDDLIVGGRATDRIFSDERGPGAPGPTPFLGSDEDLLMGGRQRDVLFYLCASCAVSFDARSNDGREGAADDVRVENVAVNSTFFTLEDGTRAFGSGADRLIGDEHRNVLAGRRGDDVLIGNGGPDVLYGEEGADRLIADDGVRDELHCGSGADTAVADRFDVLFSC